MPIVTVLFKRNTRLLEGYVIRAEMSYTKDLRNEIFNNLPSDLVRLIPLSQTNFLGHYSERLEKPEKSSEVL